MRRHHMQRPLGEDLKKSGQSHESKSHRKNTRNQANELIQGDSFRYSEAEALPQQAEEGVIDFTKPWEHSDIVFIVQGQRVFANKMILSMNSPGMKAMFEAELREKNVAEIELPGKELDTFLDLMKIVHPPTQFIEYDYKELVPLTHEYQMTHITDHCERNLLKLPPSLGLLVLADKYGLAKLREVCLEYVKNTPLDTVKQDEMYDQIELATKVEILDYNTKQSHTQGWWRGWWGTPQKSST